MIDKLKLLFKTDIIEFYCHPDWEGVLPEPVQASKMVPQWWKRLPQTISSEKDMYGGDAATAKKCFPMLDAMTLGYIIPLQGDVHITTNVDRSIIRATNPPGMKVAEFHSIKQVGGKKDAPGAPCDPIKFINYWVIKTAPGWSTLFIPPVNHMNPHFTCLSGMVDTDRYPKEVNFPAIWHTPNFDERLPAGTPLVQVIPIKRNTFNRQPKIRKMTQDEFKHIETITKCQQSRAHHYTDELRAPKK